jgi:hypothetical protein
VETVIGLVVPAFLAWSLHRAESIWLRLLIALAAVLLALIMLGILFFELDIVIESGRLKHLCSRV